jgi:endoglucanase
MKAPTTETSLRAESARLPAEEPDRAEFIPPIKVNTVGYPTNWRKIGIFNVEPIDPVVRNVATGEVALRLGRRHVVDLGMDLASRDPVWQVDFSELERPGRYVLAAAFGESQPFEIGDRVYEKSLVAGQKSFYFQRTRTALSAPFATWDGHSYLRARPSHVHDGVGWDLHDFPARKRRFALDGGWHDAGNFDIYVPSLAPAAQALLMAYEWAPGKFSDGALRIPESGNGTPDLLDEVRWGLRWILSMQEDSGAHAGGFRHRESVVETSPEGPADRDNTVRWVAGVSSAATGKAVAVLAMAARLYLPWDASFAERCARAAHRGWQFLQAFPEHMRADRRAGGAQPLWDDEPTYTDVGARFIAAVEMWRSFRQRAALDGAAALVRDAAETRPDSVLRGAWANLSRWGLATLALDPKTPHELRAECRDRLLDLAERLRPRIEREDGYRCASSGDDYYWGHNSNLMEKTHLLGVAARLAPDRTWLVEAARDQWHWVLGRNPIGYSMVTGVGRGPARMYHLEWGNCEPPPPGFLIGGPNSQSMGFLSPDAPAKAVLWDNPTPLRSGLPARSLWHWRQSDLWDAGFVPEGNWDLGWWTVTEPDILYSANFVLAGTTLP